MYVTIQDDFDLAKIMESGQCFRVKKLPDEWYRFITGHSLLYIRGTDTPGLYEAECTGDEWERVWSPYFDLGRNYAALRASIPPEDVPMRTAAACGAGIRVLRQDPFETLISFIISQRKTIASIRASVGLLASVCGEKVCSEREDLHFFPAPEAILRHRNEIEDVCRLGYRVPYVFDAAEAIAGGAISLERLIDLPDEAIPALLMRIKGVGPKVAGCVALFAYGRTSFAPIDVWIRRVMDLYYGGENPFTRYGDKAGILQQYIYYAVQHEGRDLLK